MPKNFILEGDRVNNPECILANGKEKRYSCLATGEKVLVKDFQDGGFTFIVGEILEWKMPRKVWTYRVKTEKGESWRYPSDFKQAESK